MFKHKEMQYKDEINRLNTSINELKTQKNLNGDRDKYLYLNKLNNFHKLIAENNTMPMITMFNKLIGGSKKNKKGQLVELSNIYQRADVEIDAIHKVISKNIRKDSNISNIDKINTRVDELVTLRKNIQGDFNRICK